MAEFCARLHRVESKFGHLVVKPRNRTGASGPTDPMADLFQIYGFATIHPCGSETVWRIGGSAGGSVPNGLALQRRAAQRPVRCKRLLGGGPGIVGAEVPNVPFGIAARVVPAPVVLVLDFNHDLRARRDSSCVVFVGVVDDDVRALRYGATQSARRLLKIVELARARAEPSIIIPFPKTSCAWTIVPSSPGTTRCFSNPNASQSHAMAAAASLYRMVGITVEAVVFALSANGSLLCGASV